MKNRYLFICTCLLSVLATPAYALLPPLYHTIAEIEGMLSNPNMSKALESGEPIISIERTEEGYRITSLRHRVDVTVTQVNQHKPGPAKFKYTFGAPISIDSAK